MSADRVGRQPVSAKDSVRAHRAWWDAEAADYYAEHGDFLGDAELVWGPEGWTEAELGVLDLRAGLRVLEIGGGAGQGGRWVARAHGGHIVSTDLSAGMLRTGLSLDGGALPLAQADGRALPFADATFDRVFTAYGVFPFVADPERVLAEVHRVLRPGGLFAMSTTHPIRWAFPDDPSERGLTATMSYFDTRPYVEQSGGVTTYVEHHRTLGQRVADLIEAGFVLEQLLELPWKAGNDQTWGGWSPTRGEILPGTVILAARTARAPAP